MKRAFFVLGAQGSGTRMLTRAFISAGCAGSAEHQQPWDAEPFPAGEDDIVFRRSIPHGGEIVDLWGECDRMLAAGFEVVPIFIRRKSDFLVAHQIRTDREHEGVIQAPYVTDPYYAWEHITGAIEMAYELCAQKLRRPLIVVPYEDFATEPKVRDWFFIALGLSYVSDDYFNANEHPRYCEVKALTW